MKYLMGGLAVFIVFQADARPFRIVLAPENTAGSIALANIYMKNIRNTSPFSRMGNQLELVIAPQDPKKLKCQQNSKGVLGLVDCDNEKIQEISQAHLANRVIAVSDQIQGASGGGRHLVLGTDTGNGTPLHELMHTFGFDDEYEYSLPEYFSLYCKQKNFFAPNIAVFKPQDPYASDTSARKKHEKDIPWLGEIKPSPQMTITTGSSLGTAPFVYPESDAGLYAGGSCVRVYPVWKPYYTKNVMSETWTDTVKVPPYYEKLLVQQMSSEIGEEIQLKPPLDEAGNNVQVTGSPEKKLPDGTGQTPPKKPTVEKHR